MPLNVITLGQTESDNINKMTTLTNDFYLVTSMNLYVITLSD